jgi:hypothetical protein
VESNLPQTTPFTGQHIFDIHLTVTFNNKMSEWKLEGMELLDTQQHEEVRAYLAGMGLRCIEIVPPAPHDSAEYDNQDVPISIEADRRWLAPFGVDTRLWSVDHLEQIEQARIVGSDWLRQQGNHDRTYDAVMRARQTFLELIGLPEEAIESVRSVSPTLLPPNAFIARQRFLAERSVNNKKITMKEPNTLTNRRGTLEKIFDEIEALGVDPGRLINSRPGMIRANSSRLKEKIESLQELGLDALRLANSYPPILARHPETIRQKVKHIRRLAWALHWNYNADELIYAFPTVLSFDRRRLMVLGRIAAERTSTGARKAHPGKLKSLLIDSVESIMLGVARADEEPLRIDQLIRAARYNQRDKQDRQQAALELAERDGLGSRISGTYMRYRQVG